MSDISSASGSRVPQHGRKRHRHEMESESSDIEVPILPPNKRQKTMKSSIEPVSASTEVIRHVQSPAPASAASSSTAANRESSPFHPEPDEDIAKVIEWKIKPNKTWTHRYKVKRKSKKKAHWETMEQLLGVDRNYPISKYCTEAHIKKYHEMIIQGIVPTVYEIDQILEEKQEKDGTLWFLVKWDGWPQPYNTWQAYESVKDYRTLHDFRRKTQRESGAAGFDQNYWDVNYSTKWLKYMDGVDNAKNHAQYVWSFFQRYGLAKKIQCIADFGFGKGAMLEAFVSQFKPRSVYGLEPSKVAFDAFVDNRPHKKMGFKNAHVQLECIDLVSYCCRGFTWTDAYRDWKKLPQNKGKEVQFTPSMMKAIMDYDELYAKNKKKKPKSTEKSSSKSSSIKAQSPIVNLSTPPRAAAASSSSSTTTAKEGCRESPIIIPEEVSDDDSDEEEYVRKKRPTVEEEKRHIITLSPSPSPSSEPADDDNSSLPGFSMSPESSSPSLSPSDSSASTAAASSSTSSSKDCKKERKKSKKEKSSKKKQSDAEEELYRWQSKHYTQALQCKKAKHASKAFVQPPEFWPKCKCIKFFDLALFVGVGQYMNDESFEITMQMLATWCNYLFCDISVTEDYEIMKKGSGFEDPYAIHRPRDWYQKIIKKYWSVVGNSILESKYFFNLPKESNIPNQLYHFDT